MNGMWSTKLKCAWIAWRVVDDGHLALDMPPDNCCDMRGAIKTAEALYPRVGRIDTFAGGILDITYLFDDETGRWQALDRREYPPLLVKFTRIEAIPTLPNVGVPDDTS